MSDDVSLLLGIIAFIGALVWLIFYVLILEKLNTIILLLRELKSPAPEVKKPEPASPPPKSSPTPKKEEPKVYRLP